MATVRPAQLPVHRLQVPDPATLPFAIGTFDSIGPLSRADFPHRHTFYEVQYVTSGTGLQVIDRWRHGIAPPQLGVIGPGRVHWWERAAGLRGWVLLFDGDFLLGDARDRAMVRDLGSGCPWLHLDPTRVATIASLVAEMAAEYAAGRPGYVSVLRSYLHVLLTRAYRMGERDAAGDTGDTGESDGAGESGAAGEVPRQAEQVAQRFLCSLEDSGTAAGSVREYAAGLGVSVSHLTASVKRATGRTPAQLIREDRVSRAKWLLAAGGLSVRQVANAVGFADPAYFCRFFRREVGMSPGAFRRANAENTTIAVRSPSTTPR